MPKYQTSFRQAVRRVFSPRRNVVRVSQVGRLDDMPDDFVIKTDDRKEKSLAGRMAIWALISLAFVTQAAAAPTYPLKKSANGRYLVDQNNTPFLMIGDTAWSLMVNISEADAATYFANRQAAGFNVVMMNLICRNLHSGTGGQQHLRRDHSVHRIQSRQDHL